MLERSRLLLLLLLFPLLPHNNQAEDGCHGEYLDSIEYWRCGDVCTYRKEDCFCGNSDFRFDERKWCCATNCTGGSCHRWTEGHKERDWPGHCVEWSPAKCTTGVALNLTESCGQSPRCNYHGEDDGRHFYISRSHVAACADTSTCVKEGEGKLGNYTQTICTGNSNCEGELAWCREEERKEEKCPILFTRCPGICSNKGGGQNRTKSIPGQCIERAKFRAGKENNCLDRSDEDPFQEAATAANKETIIDFGSLKNCTTYSVWTSSRIKHQDPGLECGRQGSSDSNSRKCIEMDDWCQDDSSSECPVLGEGIRTNDPTLCANVSFWRKLTCGKERIRCQGGHSGQCSYRWGIEGGRGSCSDGSDLYRPIKQPTHTEDPGSKALQADSNEHGSDYGEQMFNNDVDDSFAEEEKNPLKMGAADKRDSAEAQGGRQSQPQVWKTQPVREEIYNRSYKGKEKGAKYVKDLTTGLWMIPESNPFKVPSVTEEDFEKGPRAEYNPSKGWERGRKEEWVDFYSSDDYMRDATTNLMLAPITDETCMASQGFACKV